MLLKLLNRHNFHVNLVDSHELFLLSLANYPLDSHDACERSFTIMKTTAKFEAEKREPADIGHRENLRKTSLQ